jgi:hypothetical protein
LVVKYLKIVLEISGLAYYNLFKKKLKAFAVKIFLRIIAVNP